MPENNKHVGFKGTAKFVGWIVGIIALIFEFIMNILPAPAITWAMIGKVLAIATLAAIGVPAIFYIGDILWSLADQVKETLFSK